MFSSSRSWTGPALTERCWSDMKVGVGADHLGLPLKDALKAHLEAAGHEVVDYGVTTAEEVDYPDVAEVVARAVADGGVERAVLCCGTGLGMAITANKVPGVRAGSVTDPYSAERLVRSNNAQVICFGSRVLAPNVAELLLDHFLASQFQGGGSGRKVAKIEALDRRDGSAG